MLIAIIALLVISVVLNVMLYQKNNTYELYLSQELNNMVSPLSSSILENEQILLKVLESEQITLEQADRLNSNFGEIGMRYQSILYMGINTNKISPGEISNRPTVELFRPLSDFFEAIIDNENELSVYRLNDKEYKQIENITHMHVELAKVIEEQVKGATTEGMTGEYWDNPNYKKSINNDHWIVVLKEIDSYSIYTLQLTK
jgi:hypothetical protein